MPCSVVFTWDQGLHTQCTDVPPWTYFTGMATCADDEVLSGVQIQARDPSDGAKGMVLAAVCRKLDGSERVVNNFDQPSSYDDKSRKVTEDDVVCPDGQYGAGVAFKNYGGVLGLQLRCASSAAPSANMSHVITRFATAPPPGISYAPNPGQPNRRAQINATEAAIGQMPPNR